jgi:NAD(P)-dependent dehydrogenase (short-subunit alcohol dehydrogenase family)
VASTVSPWWVARDGAVDGVYATAHGPVWSPVTDGETGYHDEMTSLNRLGEPEHIVEAIVFLSGHESN